MPEAGTEAWAARFPGRVQAVAAVDQPTLLVASPADLPEVLAALKADGYALLLDVTAVDFLPRRPRFEVVYHLTRPEGGPGSRLRVKVPVAEGEEVPTATRLWPGADWPERETYDLFGIVFQGHPHLARIYLPDDWEGHPLRKDYPRTGFRID
ncbi:MAG: NADH-quinone oxidoreductase subunit C [Firmicutes bacterium]|nr:NADH-quinone oxidoreductase subunit C [Bacillota bacterium]